MHRSFGRSYKNYKGLIEEWGFMTEALKFKLYDSKKEEIVNYINCSISIVDGGVQSFGKDGMMKGTLSNSHLIPLQYTGKRDTKGREIYSGFIIKRIAGSVGEEDIIGVVRNYECAWWIDNITEQRALPLFSETAIDEIIGNIYENKELAKTLGY